MKNQVLAFALLTLPFFTFAQIEPVPFSSKNLPTVHQGIVDIFSGARCVTIHDTTYTVEKFPFKHRSSKIREVFDDMEYRGFENYFLPSKSDGWFCKTGKGFCRSFTVGTILRFEGIYFTRIFDEENPILIEIDTRNLPEIRVVHRMQCAIHAGTMETVPLNEHQIWVGDNDLCYKLYYKMGKKDLFNLMRSGNGDTITELSELQWGFYRLDIQSSEGAYRYEIQVNNSGFKMRSKPLEEI